MAGRKPFFTPARQILLAQILFDGLTNKEAAEYLGVSHATVEAQLKLGPVKIALHERKMCYVKKLRDGKRPDWQRIAWFLERMYPTQFSRPEVQLQINAISTSNTSNITISGSEASAISDRLSQTQSRLANYFDRPTLNSSVSAPIDSGDT
jgi:hypothetical protein